jgi:hypothetical protein
VGYGNEGNRAWIYVLTFCFCFFLATTVGMAVFAAVERVGWATGIRVVLVFLIIDVIAYNAFQKRRRATERHKRHDESDAGIV